MFFLTLWSWIVGLTLVIFGIDTAEVNEYENNINFIVYNSDQQVFNYTVTTNDFEAANCSTVEPLSFIVPGWKEDINNNEWINVMVENLQAARGGCVVVMDYYYYSKNEDYFALVRKFKQISEVLTNEYKAFQSYGHKSEYVFVFGFSFGAQLSLDLGRKVNDGIEVIARIDVCEPTSMGFPVTEDSKKSAIKVKCIHTNTAFFGTAKRDCHQDWNMGICGLDQVASGPYPKGSHGLCPFFYNSAFTNDFLAIKKPLCASLKKAKNWPEGSKMGYNEDRDGSGEYYANTFKEAPYNIDYSQNIIA